MKKWITSLILTAIFLAACGAAQVQSTSTDAPKGQPATQARPASETPVGTKTNATDEAPVSNETPSAQEATPSPLDPLPNEDKMIQGSAFVDSAEILTMESYPAQITLHVTGMLPTPCHMLRADLSQPDENGRIDIKFYSLTEPGVVCIQMVQKFDTTIPLGTYPSGTYTVYVNGEKVGEFTV